MTRGLRLCRSAGLAAASAGVLIAAPFLAPPASAGSERMQLACADGRVIERSNGSHWWGVGSTARYATEHLLITADGEVLFEKEYGRKAPDAERSTCVAEHFGAIWTVALVRGG